MKIEMLTILNKLFDEIYIDMSKEKDSERKLLLKSKKQAMSIIIQLEESDEIYEDNTVFQLLEFLDKMHLNNLSKEVKQIKWLGKNYSCLSLNYNKNSGYWIVDIKDDIDFIGHFFTYNVAKEYYNILNKSKNGSD